MYVRGSIGEAIALMLSDNASMQEKCGFKARGFVCVCVCVSVYIYIYIYIYIFIYIYVCVCVCVCVCVYVGSGFKSIAVEAQTEYCIKLDAMNYTRALTLCCIICYDYIIIIYTA